MADVKKTLETIFIEAAKVFGKEESQSLLDNVFATTKVVETKVVEKKKKSTKEENEAEVKPLDKRIGRMTKAITNKLKADLVNVGVVFSDNEEKELTNFKKKFTSYIEGLDKETFDKEGLEKHIEDFANIYKPASAKTAVSTEAEKPKAVLAGPSNAATITELSLEELQKIEIMTPDGGPKGVYWDTNFKPSGRWVTGPDHDEDEEATKTEFNKKTYWIGDKTGRIHENINERDIFLGFRGVGAFRPLKL